MSKFGLSNLQISNNGKDFTPLCSTSDVKVKYGENDNKYYEFAKNITDSVSISIKIHKRKKGNLIEKSLYYRKSKRKRIRKKWNLIRILEKGR